jgi:hypothetical protein
MKKQENVFNLSSQPELHNIYQNIGKIKGKSLINEIINLSNKATIELFTNSNPKVFFINLLTIFYNNEGVNASIVFEFFGQTAVLDTRYIESINANTSTTIDKKFDFNKIDTSILANGRTSITFIGMRIELE